MRPSAEDEEINYRRAGHGSSHGGGHKGTRRDHVVISTVIVGVALFLLVGTPYLKRHISPDGSIVNSIGRGDGERRSDPAHDRDFDRPGDQDHDRDAVRRWLRENEDDPSPQEIRWWPARELGQLHKERLEAAREAAEDDPRLAQQVEVLEDAGPDRVCRFQYRATNAAGRQITRDELFVLQDGKARLLARDSSLALAARKSFPDGNDAP